MQRGGGSWKRNKKAANRKVMDRFFSIMLSVSMILSMFPAEGIAAVRSRALGYTGEIVTDRLEEVLTDDQLEATPEQTPDDAPDQATDPAPESDPEVTPTEEPVVVTEPTEANPAAEAQPEATAEAQPEPAAEAPKPFDLRGFVKEATIADAAKDGDTYTVAADKDYALTLVFAERENEQFAAENELVYALPEGFAPAAEQPALDKEHATIAVRYFDEASEAEDHLTRFTVEVKEWKIEDGTLHVTLLQRDEGADADREDFARLASLAAAELELTLNGSFAADATELQLGTSEHPATLALNVTAADAATDAAAATTDAADDQSAADDATADQQPDATEQPNAAEVNKTRKNILNLVAQSERTPKVTVNFLDANDDYIPYDLKDDYKIVVTLCEKDGKEIKKVEKDLPKPTADGPATIEFTEIQGQLTGERYFTIEVKHVADNLTLADDAVIYWENYPYSINVAGSHVASDPSGSLSFLRMTSLGVKAELLDENGSETSTPPNKNYYVLTEASVGGEKFYALTPLVTEKTTDDHHEAVYNNGEEAVITKYTTRTPDQKSIVYRGDESVTYYILESDTPNMKIGDLKTDASNFKSYNSGQLTSEGYLATVVREGTTATATLKKTTSSTGSDISVKINLYESGSKIAAANPKINEDLYMLVTLKPKGDSSGEPLAWSVTPLTNAKSELNSSGTTTVTIPKEFKLANSEMKATGSTINFDPEKYDFTLRLYRKTGSSTFTGNDAYNEIRNTKNAVDTIERYDFIGTTKGSDNKSATLELHQSYPKSYKVRVNIDPTGLEVTQDQHYYLFIEGKHGSETSYFLTPIVIDKNTTSPMDVMVQRIDGNKVISNWQDSNGNVTPNVSIDGTWKVTPHILKGNNAINMNSAVAGTNCVRIDSGQNINDYLVDIEKMTYSEDAGDRRDYTSIINLTKISTEPALTPTDILGNAAEFGVTAGRYEQQGHTETNFAVKSFRTNSNIDIDGSGDNAIPFVVGTIDNGTQLELTKGMHVDADVYVGDSPKKVYDNTKGGEHNVTVTIYPDTVSNLENQVQALINTGLAQSAAMASKTTIAPTTTSTQFTLDTTGFPDNSTIYVDADGIMSAISSDGGLHINKRPGQSIVFNISQPGTKGSPLRIGEFYVDPNDGKGQVQSTTAALDGDAARNKRVDEVIFEHITFNVTEAKNVHLNNTAGLFLLANADMVTQSNGSGWVFAGGSDGKGGTVHSETEWHFYRHTRRYKARGAFNFKALKKLVDADGKDVAYENKNFTFELYAADESYNATASTPLETAVANGTGDVYFTSINYTQVDIPLANDQLKATKNFYYLVKEIIPDDAVNDAGKKYADCTDAEKTSGTFAKDGIIYSAAPVKLRVEATHSRTSTDVTQGKITAEVYVDNSSKFVDKTPDDGVTIYNIGNITNDRVYGYAELKAKKNDDFPWEDGDSFDFTLTAVSAKDKNGNPISTVPMPEGSSNGTKTATQSSAANPAAFGKITYAQPGTYVYTITENIPASATATINGIEYTYAQARTEDSGVSPSEIANAKWKLGKITYDAGVRTITVKVSDTVSTVDGKKVLATTISEGIASITANPTVTFTNKKEQTGSLKVRKTVTIDDVATTASALNGTYTFTIAGPDGSTHTVTITITRGRATACTVDGAAATFDADGYVEVESLKPGEYTVTETAPSNGSAPKKNNVKVTVEEGKSADATPATAKADFINDLVTGSLKVQKVVTENGKTATSGATTLAKGNYVFTVYTNEACTKQATDINDKPVTVTLTLDGSNATVTSDEVTGLIPGTYWVKETSTPSDRSKAVNNGIAKIVVEAGKTGSATVIATITNDFETGDLKVTKIVKSDVSTDHSKKFPFKVELDDETITGTFGGITFTNGVATFELADTESLTASGLPAGIKYSVTETLTTDDGKLFDYQWTGDTSGTITKSAIKDVKVTNTRKTGSLSISKKILSDATADANAEFEFTINFEEPISGTYSGVTFQNGTAVVKVKGGSSVTIDGLPIEKRYIITEKLATGFELAGITVDGKSADTASGVISTTKSTVEFSNKRIPGRLVVMKTVTSSTAADKKKQFNFRVTMYQDSAFKNVETKINGSSGQNGAYGVTFNKGVATFTLTDGQSKSIENLPLGVYYVVEEEKAEGFITNKAGETGRITTSTPPAKFFNDKDEGGLRVFKRVISSLPADSDPSKLYDIKVELSDKSISQSYGDMTFSRGVANLKLHDGEIASATGLPAGIKYTVTETLSTADKNVFTVTYQGETVSEDKVEGTIEEGVTDTAGVINTHIPGTLKVTKHVESSQDADNTRRFLFRVTLYRDAAHNAVETGIDGDFGEMTFNKGVAEFVLTKDKSAEATDLPIGLYYTVEEYAVDNNNNVGGLTAYTTSITGTGSADVASRSISGSLAKEGATADFTNRRLLTDASVKKIWNDKGNQDGIRPRYILVDLMFNGRRVGTVTLDSTNEWSKKVEGLPMYDDNGKLLTYSWAENNVPAGYTLETLKGADAAITYKDNALAGYTTVLRNTHEPETVEKTVKKVWDDNNNQDGVIKEETTLVVELLADGESTGKSVTLSKANGWTGTITGLPMYKEGSVGKAVSYTWSEKNLPAGYALTSTVTVGNTTTITNSYKPLETEATILKVWDDNNNQDAVRPDEINVTLYKTVDGNKTKLREVTLSDANKWTTTIKPLPVYENGKPITYTWDEESLPPQYILSGNVTSGTLTTITNRHTPIPTFREVQKVWRDGENRDQMRTPFITMSLMKVGEKGQLIDTGIKATVSQTNDWYAKVEGLDKYENGKEITYIWVEPDIPGYTLVMNYTSATLQTLTNVHIVELTQATVKKVWEAENNEYKIPNSLRVNLLANGKESGDYVILNAGNKWEATLTGLYKNESGKPIKYTWSEETLPDGFVLTDETTSADSTTSATITTITNTLKTGDLKVTKKVESDVQADKDRTYTFTVKLSDTSINGKYGNATFTNGEAKVEVKDAGIATIKDLPVNTGYEVTEAKVDNMTTTVEGGKGTITDSDTATATATFTNTRDQGNLEVSKVLVSDAKADKDRTYTIHVKLDDDAFNATVDGVTFKDGEATIDLKGGQSKLIEGLPAGMEYKVTEDDVDGIVEAITDNGTGTIVSKTTSSVEVKNTRDKGGFILNKQLLSDAAADEGASFTFTIELSDKTINGVYGDATFTNGRATVTVEESKNATISGLPTGITYTITEAAATGFQLVGITAEEPATATKTTATGTIVTKSPAIVFTNRRVPGQLNVYKFVRSNTHTDYDAEFEFKVTLTGLSEEAADKTYEGELVTVDATYAPTARERRSVKFTDGVATFKLKAYQEQTITGLPTGVTYKVEETPVEGFAVIAADTTGTISSDPSNAVMLNARTEGALVVYKQVDPSVSADQGKEFNFVIRLHKADGSVDTSVNENYDGVQFTNGVAELTLRAGASCYIENLPLGTRYTVQEKLASDDANLYDLKWSGETAKIDSTTSAISDSGDVVVASGTIVKNAVAMAGAKNDRKPGKLTISKAVVSDADIDKNATYTFKVELLKDDDTTETGISGTYGDMVFVDGVANVDIDIRNGQTAEKAADGLPLGVKYRVSEVTTDNDVTVSVRNAAGTVSENTAVATGTISTNDRVEFTNTRKKGGFDVNKWVTSSTASDTTRDFNFTVTLSDTTINGSKAADGTAYGVDFTNGVAKFTLKHNETKAIRNLPLGITYTVEEERVDGFQTTNDYGWPTQSQTGTVTEANENVSVIFKNNRNEGSLTVHKTVKSDVSTDLSKKFPFKVELNDKTISGTYEDITFTNGVATFELSDHESKTASGLPAGIGYAVTETLTSDDGKLFTTTWHGETTDDTSAKGTTVYRVSSTARAENIRKPGELDVTKTVESDVPGDKAKQFNFRVTLGEKLTGSEGIHGAYGVTFANGVAEFTLTDGQTQKIQNLPVGITYTVEEYAVGDSVEGLGAYKVTYEGETGTISDTVSTAKVTNERIETEASVKKVWKDKDNQDGIRPANLRVNLTARIEGGTPTTFTTVTLNETNGWTAKVADLPLYDDATGKEIIYSWDEGTVPAGYKLSGTATDGTLTTLTNTHSPEKTKVTVKKVWNDAENQDGKRPESLDVKLLANGVEKKRVTLTAPDWSYTETGLDKYEKGVEIAYSWAEDETGLHEGYTLTGTEITDGTTTFTNSYKPEETTASVQKVWDDADNQDGKRPESLVMTLSKTVDGTTEALSGTYTVNGQVTEIMDGKVTLNADNGWAATVKGLPLKQSGKTITYSWDEKSVPSGYTFTKPGDLVVSGTLTTVTNHYTPEETEAEVIKVWDDNSNQDGVRPYVLVVALMKQVEGETEATEVERVSLNASNQVGNNRNKWSYKVTSLPAYQDGKKISYFWVEWDLPVGYELVTDKSGTEPVEKGIVTTLTNFHKPEKVDVSALKVWDDMDDLYKLRPASLTLSLLANGVDTGKTVTLSVANSWTDVIKGLDKYQSGKLIEYSWDEKDLPDDYELISTDVDGYAFTLTNALKTGSLKIYKSLEGIGMGDLTDAEKKAITFTVTGRGITETVTLADFVVAEGETLPSYTLVDLPVGTYTVTEKGAARANWTITTTYDVEDGKTEVIKGETAEVTVTNAYEQDMGQLELHKTVVTEEDKPLTDEQRTKIVFNVTDAEGNPVEGSPISLAEFEVDEDQSTSTATSYKWVSGRLPIGTYTIQEVNSMYDWVDIRTYTVDGTTTSDHADAAIKKDDVTPIDITDTLTPSSLTISKELVAPASVGEAAGKQFTFTVVLMNLPKEWTDTTYSGVAFAKNADGSASGTFTLKGGEEKTIVGLPIGVTYIVTEAEAEGYVLTGIAKVDEDETVDLAARSLRGTISSTEVKSYGATFTNSYVPPEGSVVLTATKKLNGRTLVADEFAFELKDADGKVLQTKSNDGSGRIVFDPIAYGPNDAGKTFTYTISEVKGTATNVTYDTHTAKVTVEVKMVDGKIEAVETYDAKAPATFVNTYNPPKLPKTGDVTNFVIIYAMAMVGALSLAVGMLWRRREE